MALNVRLWAIRGEVRWWNFEPLPKKATGADRTERLSVDRLVPLPIVETVDTVVMPLLLGQRRRSLHSGTSRALPLPEHCCCCCWCSSS